MIRFRKASGLPTFSRVPPHARARRPSPCSPLMTESNRRQTFRIVYPRDAFPTFEWAGDAARVIDCSERGFRVEVPSFHELPGSEQQLLGRIRFPDGSSVRVCGVVRHVRGRVVGVHFDDPGVPWRVMLREQLRLRAGKREPAEKVAVYRRR